MKQTKLIDKIRYQTPLSFGLLVAFFGLYFGALLARPGIIAIAVTASVLLCAAWQWIYFRLRGALEGADAFCHRLLIAFSGLQFLSLFSFTVRSLWQRAFSRSLIATGLLSALFAAWMLFGLYLTHRMRTPKEPSVGRFVGIRNYIPIGVILGILFLFSIETFDSWFRWDSYDYYYYFHNLDYSTLDFFDNLRPANHAAYGASALYLMIDGLVGVTGVSLLLLNMLMVLLGTLAFWRILCRVFPHWNPVACALGASLFGFSPFLMGLQWSVGLETYLVFGLVIFLWAEVENMPLLQTAAALLICFSKETGALLLASMIVARLVMNLLRRDRREKPLLSKLEPHTSIPILLVGILWLADYLGNSWTSSNNMGVATDGNAVAFNCFSFNTTYIKDRLISLVFTNLTWVILLTVLIGLTVGILRKRIAVFSDRFYLLIEVSAGVLASLVPLFLFVTYNHIRYAGPTVILLLPLLVIAIDCLFTSVNKRTFFCGFLGVWLFAQSFITADPMMYLFFDRLDKGVGTVSLSQNTLLHNSADETAISVRAQYNRELMYFDEAFDDLMRQISYDEKTLLVISDSLREPSIGDFVYAEYLVTGFGYPYMDRPRYMAWDAQLGTRYLTEDPDAQMRILYAANYARISATMRFYDRCVYIALPFLSKGENQSAMIGFRTEEIGKTLVGGWDLVAYELTKY